MNVTLNFDRDEDGLDTLYRAVMFARDLRAAGFQVRVRGDLIVDARWVVMRPAPQPDATPTPKHRAQPKAQA